MIEEYKFGQITIGGKKYNFDAEVRWTGEVLQWQRKESHIIDFEDVARTVSQRPDTIIIGTGAYGVARVTPRAEKLIKDQGIELIIDKTEEAIKTFNIQLQESKEEEGRKKKIIGLFHLTC
ncbi:MAG: MTH938/NDUFAF3 family protein [Candidatus Pacebacteria bacterium]|nr:MTH938/NDUFAF3 family protein [Candidatus Paceibacterota bacterium]